MKVKIFPVSNSVEEILKHFKKMPKGTTSLDLSACKLSHISVEILLQWIAMLPSSVSELDLSSCLRDKSKDDLIKIVLAIPSFVKILKLGEMKLGSKHGNGVKEILSAVPKTVESLYIGGDVNLDFNSVEELATALSPLKEKPITTLGFTLDPDFLRLCSKNPNLVFGSLPKSITSLYVDSGYLYSAGDISGILTSIGKQLPNLKMLNLGGNQLQKCSNLSKVFASIPGIYYLDLSNNFRPTSLYMLAEALPSLSKNIHSLNLRDNFKGAHPQTIIDVCKNIPPSVSEITLHWGELIHLSEENLIDIGKALAGVLRINLIDDDGKPCSHPNLKIIKRYMGSAVWGTHQKSLENNYSFDFIFKNLLIPLDKKNYERFINEKNMHIRNAAIQMVIKRSDTEIARNVSEQFHLDCDRVENFLGNDATYLHGVVNLKFSYYKQRMDLIIEYLMQLAETTRKNSKDEEEGKKQKVLCISLEGAKNDFFNTPAKNQRELLSQYEKFKKSVSVSAGSCANVSTPAIDVRNRWVKKISNMIESMGYLIENEVGKVPNFETYWDKTFWEEGLKKKQTISTGTNGMFGKSKGTVKADKNNEEKKYIPQ